ncbi:B2 bradykinin receptor-like [Thunnus albacares]|uniref:B2 bradykinin receptor-like n=1 Tax=Thunnus albacares TaxID=8236 RepID=UPI001CF64F99|nr:B2 bradykinin receptor-like [Thunnus albacares]
MAHLPTSVPTNFSTTAVNKDHNSTNGTDCPLDNSEEWMVIYIWLIAVLGIVFNVFVLTVFYLHKKAFTVAEIYLSNLAATDLVLVSCLPFWAVNVAHNYKWPFGDHLCRLVNLGINMNVCCSIYFLVLIVMDRYVALVHPLSHDRFRRPKFAKLCCLLVWGFGLLLGVPTLYFREAKGDHCYLKYPNDTIHLLCEGIMFIFRFILPISIITWCTVKIIQALKNRSVEGLNTPRTEHKATTLVLVVLVAFLICWVPFHLYKILDSLRRVKILKGCDLQAILHICSQIFTYLAFFNSVLNPILYIIVGKNFQKKVRELFSQRSIRRTTTLSLTSTRSNLISSVRANDVC